MTFYSTGFASLLLSDGDSAIAGCMYCSNETARSSALYELSIGARMRDGISHALGVLKTFSVTFGITDLSVKLGVDATVGLADSGDLGTDLTALFVAVSETARENGRGVLVAVDELQYLEQEQLSAIFVALHRTTQRQLPLVFVGTCLPQLPAIAGNAKSYAERLFDFPTIGALSRSETDEAIRKPAHDEHADVADDALEKLFQVTRGYAYFVQEWAYRVWNEAPASPITRSDVLRAEVRTENRRTASSDGLHWLPVRSWQLILPVLSGSKHDNWPACHGY